MSELTNAEIQYIKRMKNNVFFDQNPGVFKFIGGPAIVYNNLSIENSDGQFTQIYGTPDGTRVNGPIIFEGGIAVSGVLGIDSSLSISGPIAISDEMTVRGIQNNSFAVPVRRERGEYNGNIYTVSTETELRDTLGGSVVDGDIVSIIAPIECALTGTMYVNQSIWIRGADSSILVTNSGTAPIFTIMSNDVLVSDLTIRNTNTGSHGSVYLFSSSATGNSIEGCVFEVAATAIWSKNTEIQILDSTFHFAGTSIPGTHWPYIKLHRTRNGTTIIDGNSFQGIQSADEDGNVDCISLLDASSSSFQFGTVLISNNETINYPVRSIFWCDISLNGTYSKWFFERNRVKSVWNNIGFYHPSALLGIQRIGVRLSSVEYVDVLNRGIINLDAPGVGTISDEAEVFIEGNRILGNTFLDPEWTDGSEDESRALCYRTVRFPSQIGSVPFGSYPREQSGGINTLDLCATNAQIGTLKIDGSPYQFMRRTDIGDADRNMGGSKAGVFGFPGGYIYSGTTLTANRTITTPTAFQIIAALGVQPDTMVRGISFEVFVDNENPTYSLSLSPGDGNVIIINPTTVNTIRVYRGVVCGGGKVVLSGTTLY